MKPLGIRNRILLAALAPAALVALLVSAVLVASQVEQTHIDQHRRLGALARQLSAAAEYNLFVGNTDGLRGLLDAALAEPDVMAAVILDSKGNILASSMLTEHLPTPQEITIGFAAPLFSEAEHHWHGHIIRATNYGEDDLFAGLKGNEAPLLGQLLLQISNRSLSEDLRHRAFVAAATTLFMLFLGLLLALALSRNLIRILDGIRHVLDGIGQGATHLRVENIGTDELGHLAEGINEMAAAVEQTQEDLALRIEKATVNLRRERDAAEAASQARARFFTAASHDLRQPLQALGLFVARLEHDTQQTPLLPRVHKIGQTVHSLHGLLDMLLDYSRLDGQVYRVEYRPVRAQEVIDHLIDDLAETAFNKHLALRSRVADCWLMTDPALLHRILLNLLGNAIRHTESGGILVACRRGATHARIEVWDTGPGIPAEAHHSIFEELVQLNNPERDAEKGLGLGLAIVRKTADLLEHPLALCSRVGQGSRFSIGVPLTDAPQKNDDEISPQESDTPLEQAQILVIGQQANGQEDLAAPITDWGCKLFSVDNANAAHDWITSHGAPQAIIWSTDGGAAGIEEAMALLDWLETATDYLLPALIIGSGPVPQRDGHHPGTTPRLLLARPFRPARLRALLTRLLEPQDEIDE